MLRPRPLILRGPCQSPGHPGTPPWKRLEPRPAQQGAFPGRPAGPRSLRAAPTIRSLGSRPQGAAGWTQLPTPGGAEIRAAAAQVGAGHKGRFQVTSSTQRRPFKAPSITPSPNRSPPGTRSPETRRATPAGRWLSSASSSLPACTAPPPLPSPPPLSLRLPLPSSPSQSPLLLPFPHSPPTLRAPQGPSPADPAPRARARDAAAPAAATAATASRPGGRAVHCARRAGEQLRGPRELLRGGRGWAFSSARPHPTLPTPPPAPSSPGARSRARARKSGVGAECGLCPGWVREARRR